MAAQRLFDQPPVPPRSASAPPDLPAASQHALITRHPLAESDDGKLLLVPCGRTVRVMSTASGLEVGRLHGHVSDVTSVILDASNPTQAYSASLDGTIRLWDIAQQAQVQVHTVGHAIHFMAIQATLGVAYLSCDWKGVAGRTVAFELAKSHQSPVVLRTRSPASVVVSGAGGLVATCDKHSLLVWRSGLDLGQCLNLTHTKAYTCVAFSADESVMAAGDVTGRIQVWRNIGAHVPEHGGTTKGAARKVGSHVILAAPPTVTTVHWHANPVGCLAFSQDAMFLYSGGMEAVLVSWQTDSMSPSFLPRLGGSICGIHTSRADPARLLLRQQDNTLRILNMATRCVDMSIYGLQPAPFAVPPHLLAHAVALQPASGGRGGSVLSLPVANAELQLYDVRHSRHVALVQIAPRNKLPFSDNAKEWGPSGPPAPPHVSHVTFSSDGSVMVTVDSRPGVGGPGLADSCLKFWDLANATTAAGVRAPFALNTTVDDPHRGTIRSLVYHPDQHTCVTTGGDGQRPDAHTFRLWSRVRTAVRPGSQVAEPTAWHCRCVGSYKDQVLGCAAFSSDGSALAVAAGERVTLWEAHSCALAAVMAPGGDQPAPVTHLAFVPNTHYLVSTTSRQVVVWDVLSTSILWSRALGVCDLAIHPSRPGSFAVAIPYRPRASPQQAAALAAAVEAKATIAVASGKGADAMRDATLEGARATEALRPACAVLVFDAASPSPTMHCTVPNAALVVLRYGPADLADDGRAPTASSSSSSSSALLIITSERRIVVGAFAGDGADADTTPLAEEPSTSGAAHHDPTSSKPHHHTSGKLQNGSMDAAEDDEAQQAGQSGPSRPGAILQDSGAPKMELRRPAAELDAAFLKSAALLGLSGRRDVVVAARRAAASGRRRTGAGGAGAAPEEAQRRKALLDAPSHVLPRAAAQALAFLQLL